MPVLAKRYTIRFEDSGLRFSETYPPGLDGILSVAEFDSIIRKVNEDMTLDIREAGRMVRKWAIVSLSLCLVIIGFALTPVVFVKLGKQKRELKRFWERLRAYFGEINRKTFMKRNLEWKLVEDKKKLKGRDVVNPLFAYRIEIIHRKPRVARSRTASTVAAMGGDASTISTMSSAYSPRTSTIGESSTGKRFPSLDEENELDGYEYEEDAKDDSIRDEDILIPGVAPLLASVKEEDELLEGDGEESLGELASGIEEDGYYASTSSVGAGSYGRNSLISASMAAAVATSLEQIRRSALIAEAKEAQARIDMEAVAETETPGTTIMGTDEGSVHASGRRHSRVRFSDVTLRPSEREMEEMEMTERFLQSDGSAFLPHEEEIASMGRDRPVDTEKEEEAFSPVGQDAGLPPSIISPHPTSPLPSSTDVALIEKGQEEEDKARKDETEGQENDFIIISERRASPTEEHEQRIEEEAVAREEEFLVIDATPEDPIGAGVPPMIEGEKSPPLAGEETPSVALDKEATDMKEGECLEQEEQEDEAATATSDGEEESLGSVTDAGSLAASSEESFFILPTVEEYETEKPLPPLPPSSGSEAEPRPSSRTHNDESGGGSIGPHLTPPPSPTTVRRNNRRNEIIALLTDRHHRREVMDEEHLDVHEMIDNVRTWIPPPLAPPPSPLERAATGSAEDGMSIVEVEPLTTPSANNAGDDA